jgi:cation diffusion facilitator CzcD-associated flavoprotein CzcO/predicted ATP-grasp superfamily ATP-dependent carboligase
MATVLITDAHERAMLAAARSLHRAGWRVHAAASQRPAPGQWSRACDARFQVTDPKQSPAAFAAELEEILGDRGEDVLLPGSDASLLAISADRERLEARSRIGLPEPEAVARSLSKIALNEAAEGLGFEVPETIVCDDEAGALAAAERLGYPLLLKPDRSVFERGGVLQQRKSAVIYAPSSLRACLPQFGDRYLLQRQEAGAAISFAGVIVEERMIASVFSRYRRTWPPDGGSVSYSETLTPQPALQQRVRDLLVRIGWQGMFELELVERADGDAAPIDLNPRAYGSLALAERAGVPLAVVWCEWLLGNELRMGAARPGVRYRWEDSDVRHMLWQLRRNRPGAALAVLRPRRRTVKAHFELTDPLPLAARLGLMARHRAKPSRGSRSQPGRLGRLRQALTRRARPDTRVAVIGAGPYGLAAAAFLDRAGISTHVIGRPMEFWRTQMPHGMLLRSRWRSSHIADPGRGLTLDVFERERGAKLAAPIPIEDFIAYGEWYQRRVVPEPDQRRLELLERANGGFELGLDDGETIAATHVVVATGLREFASRPQPLAGLPADLVSHSADHVDFAAFDGKSVLVVGGGQSALESAALLCEAGADVEVLARRAAIKWLQPDNAPGLGARVNRLILPPTDVGGRVTGWIAAAPDLYRGVPEELQPTVYRRVAGPAGADWLRPRLERATLTMERKVVRAEAGGGVEVELDDGSTRTVDHVLMATGFDVDMASLSFLGPSLLAALERASGYPVLGPGLESSVPGLHIIGAPASHSFGPIMRFVVGTWYAAPALTERIAGIRRRPLRLSYRPRHAVRRVWPS